MKPGTTPGVTYDVLPTSADIFLYDQSVNATLAPAGAQTPAGTASVVGALLSATSTTPAVPAVSGLSPASGPTVGGTPVSITGTALSGATAVDFGSSSATFTVNSATQITATAPAGTGTVNVTVVTPGGTSATGPADAFTFVAAPPGTPHIMVVMMENEGYSQVVGGSSTPYITSLADDYGIATQSYALTHPSLPNYLDLYSGSNQGVTVDEPPSSSGVFNVPTLESQMAAAGIPMKAYAEDLPADPTNDSGSYVVHHNPWEYFTDPPPLADATTMVSDLNSAAPPDFVWYTPNEIDDGDSGLPQATILSDENSFLSSLIPQVQSTSWYQSGGQIVVDWDEGLDTDTSGLNGGNGGQIATIVVSAALGAAPQQDATPVDTSGVLHSIETAYGLPALGTAALAANGTIRSLFTPLLPSVTGVSPTAGTTAGGTSVTITGTNFTNVSTVDFGSSAATTYTVNSATQITATAPSGTGTVDVTVTTTAATSATSSADHYTYDAPPTVTGLAPTQGSTSGGTTVVITGTNLTGATGVSFGSSAATTYTVNSATQITATAPAGTGTVDVTVTNPGGTSATSPADDYAYVILPTVTGVSPAAGPTAGGTSVVITGTNFTNVTGVSFGSAPATTYTVNGPTQITATAPSGSGTVDVTVTTTAATSATSSADHYTYEAPPTVTGLAPTQGSTSGGTTVVITGTNLTGATGVSFGSSAATTYTVNSPTQITATAPAGTGTVDVTVVTPGGTSATSPADDYAYVILPTVSSLSPTSGPAAGGTSVVITGSNFINVTGVSFGSTTATTFTVNGPTQITATAPAGTGIVDVTVTNPGGTSATGTADRYTYVPAPVVTSVSPSSGSPSGGTTVIITGTNFTGATAVDFGSSAATTFTVNSATQITATAPVGSGTVDITVATPGGTSATSSADHYAYNSSPVFTAVGTLDNAHGTDVTTLAVSPGSVGDVLVLAVKVSSGSITVSSVSGGGVVSWTKIGQQADTANAVVVSLWMGTVGTAGPATVSVSFSASVTSVGTELALQEFSSGLGASTTWAIDKTGSQTDASSSTVAFPGLAPAGTDELYVGYAWVLQEGEAGTTPGVTYDILPTSADIFLYDPGVSTTVAPAAAQAPAGTATVVGALLTATH